MAGVDFMTVAHWLGHSDGGVLVGKVYAPLADEHKRRMADNLKNGALANGSSALLTLNKIRGTVTRLHELGFFARVTPDPHGRRTYYSNRMIETALRHRIFQKLTFAHNFAADQRGRDGNWPSALKSRKPHL